MTGLEERGVRPDPMHRGRLAAYMYAEIDREMRLGRWCVWHEILWGTPCGPTLSMLPGHGPRGLSQLM